MKNQTITSALSALALATLFSTGTALAHSQHDHSSLPIGWTFDSKVMSKIEKNMNMGQTKIGMNSLEQKMLAGYGIGVGNSFNTRIGNQTIKVTRTNSGIRLGNPVKQYADGTQENLPLHRNAQMVRSSFTENHPGHDHQHLALSWVFNPAIEGKIHDNRVLNGSSGAIGLSTKEQKTLDRYGIKVGNSFNANVDGMTYTVKRTSMGLSLLKYVEGRTVASVEGANNDAY
ncbi:MAG: hypothetical protein G3M70_06655 [Candidatus Nitronauta litoralis]|uniref:Uncharacterized protein n=1 Tax=Candidatus Nitronauta litoralis TaxID=2705533 RepID=A0A7T0BW67_9BACT|nr:MAG: hypothetical protein G3M70_06655 [Candidatus Nitronauta litoralis]